MTLSLIGEHNIQPFLNAQILQYKHEKSLFKLLELLKCVSQECLLNEYDKEDEIYIEIARH